MEATGKIKKVLEPVSGESERGFWTRRSIIVESINTKRLLCIEFSGEDWSAKLSGLKEDAVVVVHFNPESTEYQSKWYTRLKGYGLDYYEKQQIMTLGE